MKNQGKPIIEIKNITKKYGNNIALEDVSLSIYPGDRIGVVGANGAGKTTLAEIVTGVTKPTSGSVIYNFKGDKKLKDLIGMQFQDANYPSGVTVKDILKFATMVRKMKISEAKIRDLLETFQMLEFYHKKAKSLSGGQKQKLNILLSIMHEPEFIVLDEISTGLDVEARDEIIFFTNKLLNQKNMATFIISHHMYEIKDLCDKIIILNNGKVEEIATIKDIETKHGDLHTFLKSIINKSNQELSQESNNQKPKYRLWEKIKAIKGGK